LPAADTNWLIDFLIVCLILYKRVGFLFKQVNSKTAKQCGLPRTSCSWGVEQNERKKKKGGKRDGRKSSTLQEFHLMRHQPGTVTHPLVVESPRATSSSENHRNLGASSL
jgi:hypothetical protein